MRFLCKLGLHDYGRAHYTDLGATSNVRDYRQRCKRCNHTLRWTQPKGIDYRFYPKYLSKRNFWKYVLGTLLILAFLFILLR